MKRVKNLQMLIADKGRDCFLSAILLLLSVVLASCEHRKLVDPSDRHYVRIYLDEHLRNVHYGFYDETKEKPKYKTPRVVRVTLSDPETGRVVGQRYLHDSGSDERGNYLSGYVSVPPGEYNLLAYNFDTESTHINNGESHTDMEVYTNVIDESLSSRLESVRGGHPTRFGDIRYEPDHVFVASVKDIHLDSKPGGDTIRTPEGTHPVAESVTKTYYMQVNVKGVEYVRSAVALITGMSGSVRMHDRSLVPEMESSIYFNLQNGQNRARTDDKVAVAQEQLRSQAMLALYNLQQNYLNQEFDACMELLQYMEENALVELLPKQAIDDATSPAMRYGQLKEALLSRAIEE